MIKKKPTMILTTKSENTRNYNEEWKYMKLLKVAKIQNFIWDKNDFYVIHLAKRDNKGCVPNLHIKILPFPNNNALPDSTLLMINVICNSTITPTFNLVKNGKFCSK